MNIKNKKYVSLLVWITSLMLMSSAIGFLTKNSIETWYITLHNSSLTPPNYIFGIVWSILYMMIAVSGWKIWNSDSFLELRTIKILYGLQLILNWSWTPLFFTYHLIGTALLCLSLIVILVSLIIVKSYRKIRTAGLLLLPYLAWLLYALYLNFYIWYYN